MIIPMRAGPEALVIEWDMEEFASSVPRANVEIERVWAGLLTVVRDAWPDWPVEVWATVEEAVEEVDPTEEAPLETFHLRFAVYFGGEDRSSKTAAAMASFVLSAIHKALPLEPASRWDSIDPTWKPMWAVDDGEVYRLFSPEATLEESLYLVGAYAGRPTMFAATLDAWPLGGAYKEIGIRMAEADVSWAFDLYTS